METVTINPSIAVIVNITPIGVKEIVPIYFAAEQNWAGSYELKLYNSDKKNSTVTPTGTPIAILTTIMTWTIDPTGQAIPVDNYYYEITHVESKRILFKGNLNIVL